MTNKKRNQNIGFSSHENANNIYNGNNNYNNNNYTVHEPKLNQIYADSIVKQIFVSSDQNPQLNENAQKKNLYEIPYQQQQQQLLHRQQQQEQIVQSQSNNYENNLNSQQDNYNTQTNIYYSKYIVNDSDYQGNSSTFNPSNNRSGYSENEFDNQEEYSSYLKSQRAKEERMQKKQQKKQKLIEQSQHLPKRLLRSQQNFNKSSNCIPDSDPSNQSLSTCLSYETTLSATESQSTLQRKMQEEQLSNKKSQNNYEITDFKQQNESYYQINLQNQQNDGVGFAVQSNLIKMPQVQDFSLEHISDSNNSNNNNSNNNIYYTNNLYNNNNNNNLYQQNEAIQGQLTSYDIIYSNSQIQNNQAIQKNKPSFQENRILQNNFDYRTFHYNQNEKNSSYTDIISYNASNASEQLVCSNQQLNSQINQIEYIEEIEDQNDLADALIGIDLQAVTKKNVVKNIMSAFKRFICYIFEYKQNEKQTALTVKHHLFTKQQIKIYFQDNQVLAQQSIELCKDIILNIFKNSHSIPTQTSEMDFFKKFKRYINHKQFNNSTISLLIRHENYGPIFKFYLENYIQKWIDNSLNSNQKSHEDIIKYILCSFSNFKLLDQFIYRCKKQTLN
ncbi:hypothetical protein TTHERM_00429729 (macronuclear) [Tetrahymena thermophila SB210]|uniref:Uncharacterized protein n=1 Tax=Tetrahymena thermophila (strain SB210) TaxID=312017 RepID=A4VEC8_TETTS|nr:hypothetical protein TTHERM_00429729 [Tetrahymena thermophila SB210]EDK31881.1 hypothetical protein TTHERM_00429729 [Tetrahymena thermophila SB210]|eukprot:XP_001471229.1 hypothetical protein TTHERM_00429729 [Tetrahymena thermophila SB210]